MVLHFSFTWNTKQKKKNFYYACATTSADTYSAVFFCTKVNRLTASKLGSMCFDLDFGVQRCNKYYPGN